MASRQIVIRHADHGINDDQMEWIKEDVLRMDLPEGFFIDGTFLPTRLGTIPNALWGPASGDAPIGDDQVILERRGGRPYRDRMAPRLPLRPTREVTLIGMVHADGLIELYTVYGGPLAEQNPEDPSCSNVDEARDFWTEHALSTGDYIEIDGKVVHVSVSVLEKVRAVEDILAHEHLTPALDSDAKVLDAIRRVFED